MASCGGSKTQNHLDLFVFISPKQRWSNSDTLQLQRRNEAMMLFSPNPVAELKLSHELVEKM